MAVRKDFGPRNEDGTCLDAVGKVANDGVDFHFTDGIILRFLVAMEFDMGPVADKVMQHLEWRQTLTPVPLLTDKTLKLLQMGLLFLHGRCKDGAPCLYLDFGKLEQMLDENLIDAASFASLHAFVAGYLAHNMLLPGQVEKWIAVVNINQFPLTKLPVRTFRVVAQDLGQHWIDWS